ncbi:MAG: DMT family transporter [Chthoniobacterales bacterium]|nr:DMT family transporter [Chthoniobacterales bacterium]
METPTAKTTAGRISFFIRAWSKSRILSGQPAQGKPRHEGDCDKNVTRAADWRGGAEMLRSRKSLSINLPLLLPLASAVLYAAGAILIKLGISRGANAWAVTFFSNLSMGLLFLPLVFFGRESWNFAPVAWALAASVLFFTGQIATFRSLAAGDVSIATPALASKVVFVALILLAVPENRPDPDLWLAVVLTMGGVILLHRGPRHTRSHPLATLAWALLAAFCFAATDVIIQVAAPRTGFTLFMPVMFGTVAALSFPLLLPHVSRGGAQAGKNAWFWGTAGIVLLAVQLAGVALTIGIFGNATGVNVVYSSRGLWSLILVALLARRLGVTESALDKMTLCSRVAGSVLILAAVILVVL